MFFSSSRAHIQRCQGDTDPTNLPTNPITDEDGSLESADIDESESSNLDVVRFFFISSLFKDKIIKRMNHVFCR